MTVTHDMTVQEALEVFRRYNSMTEVVLEGQVHFVYAMMPGEIRFLGSEMRIRDEFWLFGLRNGLYVSVKDQKNRI